MFDFEEDLRIPIVGAPMAGGPSTPELVAAVSSTGGLGFLAAGYKSVDAVRHEVDAVRALTDAPFGLNLFVPGRPLADRAAVETYRERLQPLAERRNVVLPEVVDHDDDAFDAKVDLAVELAVSVVSFTFGLPPRGVVDRLHAAGTAVVATVSDVDEARAAAERGVDAICLQGVDAGGHRATLDPDAEPDPRPTRELVEAARAAVDLPLVAAGGIATGADVAATLEAGATAVQIGTALLDADEAGTKPAHRAALHDARFTDSVVTRAFSGRPARGLVNDFIIDFDAYAVTAYPQVHLLTSGLRAAAGAADDPQGLALWAGLGYRSARSAPAEEIVRDLWREARDV
ncbi:NAD(P)H-dependent flavin oxidoreductase [Rhodococcus koreensis]|uniref:Probable nitronate monooxygenase n=1 Tax=Rhodococcus koreensis TaxID=99653 RepID=A0A1H5BGT6_9NOCA|nr:nitronate monooxygenase [Rhodococcus koreensis]SED53596.1 nitroalkane oxidase [Rhodococcus koreensis]